MSQSESLKPSLLDPRLLGEAIINASNMPDGTIAIDGKRLVFAPDADSVFIDLSKLSAALARPSTADRGGEVEVRQLEWVQTGETSAYASSVLGQYMAFNFCWWLPGQKEAPETSFEAAKTAAQADYTARIRSALATTAGEAKPREELVVAISEELKHHEAFDGKPMAQLVWASRIYDNVLAAAPALVTDKG